MNQIDAMKTVKCLMSQKDLLFNLEQGLEMEYKARDICQDLAKKLKNPEEKKKVAAIAESEKEHIKITKNLIKIVQKFYQSGK